MAGIAIVSSPADRREGFLKFPLVDHYIIKPVWAHHAIINWGEAGGSLSGCFCLTQLLSNSSNTKILIGIILGTWLTLS